MLVGIGVTNDVRVVVAAFMEVAFEVVFVVVLGLEVVDAFFVVAVFFVDCGTFFVTVFVAVEVDNLVLVLEVVLVAVTLKVFVFVAVTGMTLVVVLE